ncbi:fluoride efflux transporter CrcB [Dehalogenimonas etheniformans]|uniref:Fluoride-specific ion channel FluC n=1 Tax=Dehalogenimonas etheniformans TaxID=1536648 RepID=A0A2P5P5P1_9CHLR|nr:fluoride efflux transporter CrcB [Dehalogenimonas etheniformans]PPD57616.1 fluoride efflux transporter CrcB [Dehalogenimonas etheniformans]QNT75957.1 fluoride efflux transporter CrcB [Dehalogenimonas etheniformans]
MKIVILIAGAGALGSVCRYALSGAVYAALGQNFPYGTLVVNVIGSFLLGLLMQMGLNTDLIPPHLRTVVAIGFLGAFTTFSTFTYETVQFIQDGAWGSAALNIATSLILGIAAVIAGIYTGRLFAGGT